MFLDTTITDQTNTFQDKLNIIVGVVSAFIVILIVVVVIIRYVIAKKRREAEDDTFNANQKDYENILNSFFNAMGGVKNVKKITFDEQKNCLVVITNDVKAINVLELANFNLENYKIIDDIVELYFDDSRAFYDSLFGK